MIISNNQMKLWQWHIAPKVPQTCSIVKCRHQRCNLKIMDLIRKWGVRQLRYHRIRTNLGRQPLISMIQQDRVQDKHLWHLNICAFNPKKYSDKVRLKRIIITEKNKMWKRIKQIYQMWKQGIVWIWNHRSSQAHSWERCWISLRMYQLGLVQVHHS